MAKRKEDKLYRILSQIDENLRKQNSTWRTFVQGLVRGFGTALGATVLVALATSIALQFTDTAVVELFLSNLMEGMPTE